MTLDGNNDNATTPMTAPPSPAFPTLPPLSTKDFPPLSLEDALPVARDPLNPFDVNGLIAVITGGGTGIGLMMARALEHNGAIVYIVGRRLEVLERAAKDNNRHNNMTPMQCDVTKRDSLQHLVEKVTARHGYINLLVNNAGTAKNLYPHPLPSPSSSTNTFSSRPISPPYSPTDKPATPSIAAFQETLWNCGSQEDFDEVFRTNVTAMYYTTVAFLELLHRGNLRGLAKERENLNLASSLHREFHPPHLASQVISVSSSGSFRRDAQVLSPSYTLSKAACTHLGKMLASLLAPWGIRSNVLAPGVWPTDMTTHPTPDVTLSPEVLASTVPLRRVGTEEDITGTILFLASRAGAYMNGSVLLTDGGRVGTVASTY